MLEDILDERTEIAKKIGGALSLLENSRPAPKTICVDSGNVRFGELGRAAVCLRWAVQGRRKEFSLVRMEMSEALRYAVALPRKQWMREVRNLRYSVRNRMFAKVQRRDFIPKGDVPDTFRILNSADKCNRFLNRLASNYHCAINKYLEFEGVSGSIPYVFWNDTEAIPITIRAGKLKRFAEGYDGTVKPTQRYVRSEMKLAASMYALAGVTPLEVKKGYMLFLSSDSIERVPFTNDLADRVCDLRDLFKDVLATGDEYPLPERLAHYECCHTSCGHKQDCYPQSFVID